MFSFGKKLREARETAGFSQKDLASKISSVHTVIGRYERDEMKPSIDVVKRLAEELGTTVGYLLGEAKESLLLKDPVMLKRFQEIDELEDSDKQCVFTLLDAFLAKNKMQAYLK